MHREEGGGGKGDNSIGTAKGLSGGGGARVKGWCERPTCMSNPRILKEGGRGCGIGVESYDRYSYIYTPFGPLKMERVHVGMPPSWSLHSPPFFHPVSSRYLDTTGFFSLASYEKYLHTPFGEIKYNSFVSIHRYAEMNRHSFLSCDSIHFYPIISYFCSLLLFNIVPFVAYVRLRISRGDGRTRKKRKTRSIPRTKRNSLRGISLSGTRQNS